MADSPGALPGRNPSSPPPRSLPRGGPGERVPGKPPLGRPQKRGKWFWGVVGRRESSEVGGSQMKLSRNGAMKFTKTIVSSPETISL
jgi:hypothetical protein